MILTPQAQLAELDRQHTEIDQALTEWPQDLATRIPTRAQCPSVEERYKSVAQWLPLATSTAQARQDHAQAEAAAVAKSAKWQADWEAIRAYNEAAEPSKTARPTLHHSELECHLINREPLRPYVPHSLTGRV